MNFISVGDNANNDGLYGYLNTAEYILSEESDAYVVTTSYGGDEENISSNLFE